MGTPVPEPDSRLSAITQWAGVVPEGTRVPDKLPDRVPLPGYGSLTNETVFTQIHILNLIINCGVCVHVQRCCR